MVFLAPSKAAGVYDQEVVDCGGAAHGLLCSDDDDFILRTADQRLGAARRWKLVEH